MTAGVDPSAARSGLQTTPPPDVLRVRRLDPSARLPARAHDDDAGCDLHALHAARLEPGTRAKVRTGIAIELPPGHAGLVLPRSGLAARHGIALVNAPGLIDAGYRGEVRLILQNTDREETFSVATGDRIAQLLIVGLPAVRLSEVEELSASERSGRGFGSSGV